MFFFYIFRNSYFGQNLDGNAYSILPSNFKFFRPEESSLSVAAVAVAASSNQLNSYDNLMNTYQNLVQQPSSAVVATLSTSDCNSSSSMSLVGLNSGIGARECTACGQIYDYELEKDLRGCK